jgi:hypothetical protein
MPLTLTEAGKLSSNILLQGIIETIVKDSRFCKDCLSSRS